MPESGQRLAQLLSALSVAGGLEELSDDQLALLGRMVTGETARRLEVPSAEPEPISSKGSERLKQRRRQRSADGVPADPAPAEIRSKRLPRPTRQSVDSETDDQSRRRRSDPPLLALVSAGELTGGDDPPRRTSSLSARRLAIDSLDLLGVPTKPTLLTWVVEARTGEAVEPKSLSAIKRDDRKRYARYVTDGGDPGPCLVPALHHARLEPLRAWLTLSSWPLERRMVTPHSAQADHVHVLNAILDEAERLVPVDPGAAQRLVGLAARLAIGLPGANRAGSADPEMLRRVAEGEEARFAGPAEEERSAAAQRASMITEHERIWGRGNLEWLQGRPGRAENGN